MNSEYLLTRGARVGVMMAFVRRDQAMLNPSERSTFVDALLELKSSGVYDNYVKQHSQIGYNGHMGPAFLPWHREFLHRFELELQNVTPGLTIPYWDWTFDNSPSASIWDANFMGGDGKGAERKVMTGRFAFDAGHWACLKIDIGAEYLTREFGVHIASLPAAQDVADCLRITPYDNPQWDTNSTPSFRNHLEGWIGTNIHNRVHEWVGGHMRPLSSPNDPLFWLHHANTDRLWAHWQSDHSDQTYLPQSGALLGQNEPDPMDPWFGTTTIASTLERKGFEYIYDTEWPAAQGDRMLPGDTLVAEQYLTSQDGAYTFKFQANGNLLLSRSENNAPLWTSGTEGKAPGGVCILQKDGDLAIFDAGYNRVWHTNTGSLENRASRFYVQYNGHASIYRPDGRLVWSKPDAS
ncbi:tyrosinase family protein [Streptomyces sp. NPDC048428]|uniref:tyrosinase family protein n=1 Tax=Streptomyces sp. NPDC048428 TaxID=3154503 RepID=UPI00342A9A53